MYKNCPNFLQIFLNLWASPQKQLPYRAGLWLKRCLFKSSLYTPIDDFENLIHLGIRSLGRFWIWVGSTRRFEQLHWRLVFKTYFWHKNVRKPAFSVGFDDWHSFSNWKSVLELFRLWKLVQNVAKCFVTQKVKGSKNFLPRGFGVSLCHKLIKV